jgi:hypothetical protein
MSAAVTGRCTAGETAGDVLASFPNWEQDVNAAAIATIARRLKPVFFIGLYFWMVAVWTAELKWRWIQWGAVV